MQFQILLYKGDESFYDLNEIEWKCVYPMRRLVNIDTNIRIFQYKILNSVLYLNEKRFNSRIFLHLFVLFAIRKMSPDTPF